MNFIGTKKFYGNKMQTRKRRKSKLSWIKTHRVMPSHILGPTQYWEEFYKQADALVAAAENSTKTDTLCTFVYQRPSDGSRKFVVAHPEVYWWYYKVKPPEEKCSYEASICRRLARDLDFYRCNFVYRRTIDVSENRQRKTGHSARFTVLVVSGLGIFNRIKSALRRITHDQNVDRHHTRLFASSLSPVV